MKAAEVKAREEMSMEAAKMAMKKARAANRARVVEAANMAMEKARATKRERVRVAAEMAMVKAKAKKRAREGDDKKEEKNKDIKRRRFVSADHPTRVFARKIAAKRLKERLNGGAL